MQERIRTGDLSKSMYYVKFETGRTLPPVYTVQLASFPVLHRSYRRLQYK